MRSVVVAVVLLSVVAVGCGSDEDDELSLGGRTFEDHTVGTKADTGEPFPAYSQCITFAEDGSWANRYHSDNAEVARGTWSETVDGQDVSFSVLAESSFAGITLQLEQTGTATLSDDGFSLIADNVVSIGTGDSFEPHEESSSEGVENADCDT